MSELFKINDPKKVIWSNIDTYVKDFTDIDPFDILISEKSKKQIICERCDELLNSELYDIEVRGYIVCIHYLETLSGEHTQRSLGLLGTSSIQDVFRQFMKHNTPKSVIGVDKFKNLVIKEIRHDTVTNEIYIMRYLYRALKPEVSLTQCVNLTRKVKSGTLTSKSLSRYTTAIGYAVI